MADTKSQGWGAPRPLYIVFLKTMSQNGVNKVDVARNIQEIKNYCDVFYAIEDLIEHKVLKIKILL